MQIPSAPFRLDSLAHRKVRYILDKPSQLQDAVLDIVAGEKASWTVKEWTAITSKIESSTLTVGEYIKGLRK
jgi:hypothetical protein|tara:strand:+ start:549 stop:764 length:216 start_codon:yes stop_codon:yes gene_type:complete